MQNQSIARQHLHCCKSNQPILWRYANFVDQNSKTPKPNDEKFGVGDYVNDNSTHAKIQNNRPIWGIAAYA